MQHPMDGENPAGNLKDRVNQPPRVVDLLASQLTMAVLALSIVALRLLGRFFVDKNPGWDDYATIAAAVNKNAPLENSRALQIRIDYDASAINSNTLMHTVWSR